MKTKTIMREIKFSEKRRLKKFLKAAYKININPLGKIREAYPEFKWVFTGKGLVPCPNYDFYLRVGGGNKVYAYRK